MKRYRTLLFVPGIKKKWFENITSSQADGIILDLEDSVPVDLKSEARQYVSEAIPVLFSKGIKIFIRINNRANGFDKDDIKAVVKEGLQGIVLPKIDGPDEIEHYRGNNQRGELVVKSKRAGLILKKSV
jgi:citrate lyase subunit beta / citryl-CoA lyase